MTQEEIKVLTYSVTAIAVLIYAGYLLLRDTTDKWERRQEKLKKIHRIQKLNMLEKTAKERENRKKAYNRIHRRIVKNARRTKNKTTE